MCEIGYAVPVYMEHIVKSNLDILHENAHAKDPMHRKSKVVRGDTKVVTVTAIRQNTHHDEYQLSVVLFLH